MNQPGCLDYGASSGIPGSMRQHGAEKIGVFGSYARNEASPNSDLDLMVWFKEQKSLLGVIRI